MSEELEQWKHLRRGAPGYHFSNFGRVLGPRGIINGEVDVNGYRRVAIYPGNGRAAKREMAHRLVAKAWIPNPDQKPFINHKDCDKLNNRPENLEWCTQKENISHSWKMGRQKPKMGEDHYHATLTNDMVIQVICLRARGLTYSAIAKTLGVGEAAVGDVVRGKSWKHVTGRAA